MTILLGMAAMEFLGLLALAGASTLGMGRAPWALPASAALPVAFAIGVIATYILGRILGVLEVGEIDTYRDRVGTMHEMSRAGRRVRPATPRVARRVVIEY
jgi:hypothetical protein